jgi:hypothetical protein
MSPEVENRCANFRLAIPNDAQMGSFVQSEPTEVGVLSNPEVASDPSIQVNRVTKSILLASQFTFAKSCPPL